MLNVIKNGLMIAESHIFNILIKILSLQRAFLKFGDVFKLIIFLCSNLIEKPLVLVM